MISKKWQEKLKQEKEKTRIWLESRLLPKKSWVRFLYDILMIFDKDYGRQNRNKS